jgi:acetolactate synthase I/II/III large subunit
MGNRMTGGEAMVAALVAHGVDRVYGLPGAQVYGLFDALGRAGMPVITPRHEQTCGYMAFGQARATGGPAAYAVVPGPGVLNTAAALLTAASANEQVLCLTGQVPTAFLGRGRGHLHEMRDQRATLAGIAKWAARADTADQAGAVVAQAFRAMASGRPGPAAVEMPWEQFVAPADCPPVTPLPPDPDPQPGDTLGPAATRIAAARAPLIFVGSGAFDAGAQVLALAERIGAPVIGFRSGRGIVSNRHPLGLTIAEARHLWPACDLVIGIGTRLEVPGWRWPARPDVPVIRFDIDPDELARTPDALGVPGRAAPTLDALLDGLRASPDPDWADRIAAARRRAAADLAALSPHPAYLAAIRAVLPDDGILVDEICQAGFFSWFAYPVHTPRSFVTSGLQGTLGSGYPTALGVAVARPGVPVVSISGDGGFMFAAQELATAAQYAIPVVAVVFNNGAFGNVRRDQTEQFGGRLVGSVLQNPDFVRLAETFGVRGARATSPDALRAALDAALTAGGPWLIEVPVGDEDSPWPILQGR